MKGNGMKVKVFFVVFVLISLFFHSGLCSAAEKNAIEIDVNASGVEEGSNIIYSDDSEMALDWSEKVYYAPKDNANGGTGNFHCAITIQNTGGASGDLYVKFDFLWPSDTTAFQMPSNLTGHYQWCYYGSIIPTLGLSNTRQKLLTLAADDSIKIFDFVATDTFQFNGPVLITAMLLDTDTGRILGVDSEMIFFNTDFKNWIRTHATP